MGLPRSSLKGHMINKHKFKLTQTKLNEVLVGCPVELAEGLKDSRIEKKFENVETRYDPIPNIQQHDGFQCLHCYYSCRSLKTIKKHHSESHDIVHATPRWRQTKVQCLFLGSVGNNIFFSLKGLLKSD
jgi:hypothetical protein